MTEKHTQTFLYTAARLTAALHTLDVLHSAAGEGTVETLNARGKAELVAMLREIAYVAVEAAHELDGPAEPTFRLVKGAREAEGSSKHDDRTDRFHVLTATNTPLPFYVMKQAGG